MGDLEGNYQKSKCLESKCIQYFRIFNYKTYCNLIISPLIVITIATFSAYLLQLITKSDSLIHQKLFSNLLSSNFSTNIKKHPPLALLVPSKQWNCQNNVWNMFKGNNNKDTRTRSLTSS